MNMSHHKGRRDKRTRPAVTAEEEEVDDILIASMAVASTWSPPPTNDDTLDDTNGDCHDADEISLDDAPNTEGGNTDTTVFLRNESISQDSHVQPTEEDSDNESEIDLTEGLAIMEDEDGGDMTKQIDTSKSTPLGIYEGPKTEHEIDPYQCAVDRLETLNVGNTIQTENGEVRDGATMSQLRLAGVVRSHLVEKRAIVVDTMIPSSLQNQSSYNVVDAPLDEGSVMAIRLQRRSDTLNEVTNSEITDSLQILGKVVEVFGPVHRPLYLIRLPDPPKVKREVIKEDLHLNSGGNELEGELKQEDPSDGDISSSIVKEQVSTNHQSKDATVGTRIPSGLNEEQEDPWSPDGKLSVLLRNTQDILVYTIADQSTLINKDQIIKISGKGCDASNMFDEELGPDEQQDFSDDDDERLAKRGNRKPRQSIQTNGNSGGRSSGYKRHGKGRGKVYDNRTNNSQQMRQSLYPTQQQAPIQQQYYYNSAPQYQQMYPSHGYPIFNHGCQQVPHYQSYQTTGGNYHGVVQYDSGVPPPPPPPPKQTMGGQYTQHSNNSTMGKQPIVPTSESDTVYYDYSGSS